MEEGRRNLLGDFLMSTAIGCATLLAFLVMCVVIASTLIVIISFLKHSN